MDSVLEFFLRGLILVPVTLLPIINPLSSAPVFAATVGANRAIAGKLARQVAVNAWFVLVGSMLIGTYVLMLFGISLPVVRIGGGLLVAATAWRMLHHTEDDDVHAVGVVGVRVGVDLVDAPVGRPAGVGDAGRGGLGPVALLVDDESLLEVVEVAHRAHAGDLVVDHDGDAGRVVAAVFELAQAGEEKLLGGPRTDVADDAAHGRSPRS